MVKVYVPVLAYNAAPGPAELALTMEGVEFKRLVCEGTLGYGEQLAMLWRSGEGFVLVENDVVPWPTCIDQLMVCPHPWCTHAYPSPPGQLHMSIGITKLTDEALGRTPMLPNAWRGEHWGLVDSKLIPALHAHFPLHGHFPPVAHCKVMP